MLEIERKFLVREQPTHLTPTSQKEVEQFYLAVGQEELRARCTVSGGGTSTCDLTVKRGAGLIREEEIMPISLETYLQLRAVVRQVLIKDRYIYDLGQYEVVVDVFSTPGGLITAEVEFGSEQAANDFSPPSWFGEDVTHNPQYKNQNLWSALTKAS